MALTITVEAEYSAGNWTAITADVLTASPMRISWGMDGGRPDDNCAVPGTLSLTLNNAAASGGRLQGRYSPGHANATAGWDLNTALRVTITDGVSPRVMGPYRVVGITPTPGAYQEQSVSVLAADWLEEAAESDVKLNAAIPVTPWTAAEAMAALIANMDRQPAATSFDACSSVLQASMSNLAGAGNRVLSAFKSLAQSVGGFVYLTSGGTLMLRSPTARSADITADYTLSNTMHGLSVGRARDALVNAFALTVHPQAVSASIVVIASLAEPLLLPSGSTTFVTMTFRDPTTLTPCAGVGVVSPDTFYTDSVANTSADGTGTDVSASVDVTWPVGTYPTATAVTYKIVNGYGADVYLTTLQAHGYAAVDSDPVTVVSESAASIASYGRKTIDVDLPYQSDANIATSLAEYWRSLYADASMRATSISGVAHVSSAFQAIALGVDVGSRITITETMSGLAGVSYWVQGVDFTLAPPGVVGWTLRLAPASDAQFWQLDVAGHTELDDTTVLGYL